MSKFTKILENHDPQLQDNDNVQFLNSLCDFCTSLGYICSVEGSTLTVSIAEEEQEGPVTAVLAAPSRKPKPGEAESPEDQRLKRLKQQIIASAEKSVRSF